MYNSKIRCRFYLMIFLSIVFFSSCASFSNKNFPSYRYDQLTSPQKKITVNYNAKYYTLSRENGRAGVKLENEIEKVFKESGYFAQLPVKGEGGDGYHFSFVMRNEANVALACISGFISGFTLLIIPGYAKDEFYLDVTVTKGKSVIKKYSYYSYMTSWTQLALIFMMHGNAAPDVMIRTWDSMIMAFLHDIDKDGILL